MKPAEILALRMKKGNDAGAATVRDYLKALLALLWDEGEGFDSKRPFGNSGWRDDLGWALVSGGAVEGEIDEDDFLLGIDEDAIDEAIKEAIEAL